MVLLGGSQRLSSNGLGHHFREAGGGDLINGLSAAVRWRTGPKGRTWSRGQEGARRSIGPAPGRDKNTQGQVPPADPRRLRQGRSGQPPAPAQTITVPPSLTPPAAASLRTGSWHRPAPRRRGQERVLGLQDGPSLSSRSVTVTGRPGQDPEKLQCRPPSPRPGPRGRQQRPADLPPQPLGGHEGAL